MIDAGTECSTHEVVAGLRARYPDTPFLALGQTVFWDEPVKAVMRRLLDDQRLGGQIVLGVHDTDYFAKANARLSGPSRFVLMPHNDGTTKSLWSAAGEVSTVFGSETFPTRDAYSRHGVAFRRLARAFPGGSQAFLDAMTEAWGWRGLVYTGSRDLIVNRLSLKEVGDGILEMLQWGFENALEQIVPGCCRDEARAVAETMLNWCQDYRAKHPDHTLSNLYQHLLPRIYSLLLGYAPQGIEVTSTADLLRLAPDTAELARFKFVDLFLNPSTRDMAIAAYNLALEGGEIYGLDRFGMGALPFDCIVPERGRGTLRVTPRVLFIETPKPIPIALKKPIESVQELAALLSARFGANVTLVGKAVSLVSMLAQEFLFLFNEEGSMYVNRTRRMNDLLRSQGVELNMHPIVRMRYETWDSLEVGRSTLGLPDHLAGAFGRQTITTPEFSQSWRQVVQEQQELCARISQIRRPLELMEFLRLRGASAEWDENISLYRTARETILMWRQRAANIQSQVDALYVRLKTLKERSQKTQREQGIHFRATKEWTPAALARRDAYAEEISAILDHKRRLCAEIDTLKTQRRGIERGAEVTQAQATLTRIELEAERARLRLVRNALLTSEGLPHTNHRPSAWWLPMLDPSGQWFRRIADTVQVYTERL